MDRRYEENLKSWHQSSNRKPLVIRGARQVGKSTLVRRFAAREKLQLYEVNLERHPELAEATESLDPKRILQEIEFICSQGKADPKNRTHLHR